MGIIHNLKDTPPEAHIQKENPVFTKIKSMKTWFFAFLDGYTNTQKQFVDSFFSQGLFQKNKTEDFLSTCSHRDFYDFIQCDPGLRKVFLLAFKERLQYAVPKNYTNYIGEFRIKKNPGAGPTHDRYKITSEDMIYYKIQMHIFKISE